jgi:DNA-binding NtrC family response regulator
VEEEVERRALREDLYYRLNVFHVHLPALRERKEDIIPLAEFFIDHYNRTFRKSIRGLTEEARRLLLDYEWPGNVRELKNAIERAMILEEEPELHASYLPFSVSHPKTTGTAFEQLSSSLGGTQPLPDGRRLPPLAIPEGGTSLEEVERAMVELALEKAQNNQTQAARLLDISRDALRYKMKKFGLLTVGEEKSTASRDL